MREVEANAAQSNRHDFHQRTLRTGPQEEKKYFWSFSDRMTKHDWDDINSM